MQLAKDRAAGVVPKERKRSLNAPSGQSLPPS